MTEDLKPDGRRQRLLLMLDEFPALGRLDFFESALAFMAGYGIKAFLIAQSLNQIEKAYGQNNAILDNCHVRVCFATNDERTAKRVSDALGTATEMRAMKNYAGHRLSPWLGHLMVSRTETARPLLTPGEVMQLPPDEEIVMAAGIAPIRARKARYYLDKRFVERILEPPSVPQPQSVGAAHSEWIEAVETRRSKKESGAAKSETPQPAAVAAAAETPEPQTDSVKPKKAAAKKPRTCKAPSDGANAGIRQEPELPAHENIVPDITAPANEFEFDRDTDEEESARARQATDRKMAGNARNAALDPGDGIEL